MNIGFGKQTIVTAIGMLLLGAFLGAASKLLDIHTSTLGWRKEK